MFFMWNMTSTSVPSGDIASTCKNELALAMTSRYCWNGIKSNKQIFTLVFKQWFTSSQAVQVKLRCWQTPSVCLSCTQILFMVFEFGKLNIPSFISFDGYIASKQIWKGIYMYWRHILQWNLKDLILVSFDIHLHCRVYYWLCNHLGDRSNFWVSLF